MARITDQDIPGALVALFGTYAAKAKATQGANGALRARRRVKRKPYKKRPNKYHAALWPLCVEAATNYAARYTGTPIEPTARRIFAAAKRGDFPAKWWTALIHATTTYHTTAPTSVERTSPNPYAYRDPNNRPTIPTYPAASAGAAPARYTGSTAAQLYRDTLLVFRRDTYKADPPAPLTDATRIIYQATGNTTAAASIRAARPLMGLCIASAAGAAAVAPITNTAPPLGKGSQVYPRYKNKKTPAPYYSASAAYDLTRLLNPARATTPPATFERATIDLAPLPAMGYRYNNNTSISTSTSLTATPTAKIPLQPLPASPFVTNYPANNLLISPYTGEAVGTAYGAAQSNDDSAGLYYLSQISAAYYEIRNQAGETLGRLLAMPPDAISYVIPYSWNKGWVTTWYYYQNDQYDIILTYWSWDGELIAQHHPIQEGWVNYTLTVRRLLRTPDLAQHDLGTPGIIANYDTDESFWTFTGLPPSTIGVASVDGLHFFSPAGGYYFANYPNPHPAIPGWQTPITPTPVTSIGYRPTTVHRARSGVLTYHATYGFRHYNADGTYTQLATSTPYTIQNYSSCNYKLA